MAEMNPNWQEIKQADEAVHEGDFCVIHPISKAGKTLTQATSQALERGKQTAGDMARRVSGVSAPRQLRRQLRDIVRGHPLAIAAGCLAGGVLAGLMVPIKQQK